MKKWEKPDMLVLDIEKTAFGSDSETRADKAYWDTVPGTENELRLCYQFGISGREIDPSDKPPRPDFSGEPTPR